MKVYFWEILHGTVDSRKYGWVRDTVWEWGQMELTYCFLCSCCTSCGAKNQTRKKKYFSFLNTDLFQVSLWFPLNNDSNMANALGRRCSIPVYKREMEMERAQVVRELALGNCVLWLVFGCMCAIWLQILQISCFPSSWSFCLHVIYLYISISIYLYVYICIFAKNEII